MFLAGESAKEKLFLFFSGLLDLFGLFTASCLVVRATVWLGLETGNFSALVLLDFPSELMVPFSGPMLESLSFSLFAFELRVFLAGESANGRLDFC